MPSPSSTATGTHLTTSRIHRILRPLKTKCASFAVAASLAGGQSTGGNRMSRTNSSSSSPTNPGEPPPLAVLPPPEQTRHFKSSSQYDSSWNQLSLSKNIYGIRDAFKNVLNIAFGGGWDDSPSRNFASSSMSVDSDPSTSNRHVVSLAGLCAIVVGKELGMGQDGDGGDDEDGTDDENCENDDEEVTKWVDGIYEEIPFHVRRWAVVSHALQIVLQSCPPHPTLLHLLLEVFTTHLHSSDMIPLAETILRSLITVSFTSPSNPTAITPLPPPVCHVAHPNFLISLLSVWRNSGFGDCETFLSILLDVSIYGTSEAWTSRAVLNLAKELSNDNFSTLVRMAASLIELIAQSKCKTSKVDKRPAERRMSLLHRWLQQIFDRLVYTDYVEGDTELCLRCLELISTYFGSGLGSRLLAKGGKSANQVDSMMINVATWFLAVCPPAFSPVEDARRLIRSLQSSNARPTVFTPLITRFFGSVSDDDVPWDMLDQLHSFALALSSNELYELELSMVKQIREEFQGVFGVTLGYEPEYERIMGDLQESIKNAEAATRAAGPPHTRASTSQLAPSSITPLIPRRRCPPLLRSRYSHRKGSSPSPYRQRSQSQSPPPPSPVPSKSMPRTATPPTPNKHQSVPPPPKFSRPFPQTSLSLTPPKKRKLIMAYVELTPWAVKKRRIVAQERPHTPKSLRASLGDHTYSLPFDARGSDLETRNSAQNRLVRVVDKERHSSADTASSCSPTSVRARSIASRRCNRAPSPSPRIDEDDHVSETSDESVDPKEGRDESDFDEEEEDDPFLPTSDDPLNLLSLPDFSPRMRPVCNEKLRLRPRPCTTLYVPP